MFRFLAVLLAFSASPALAAVPSPGNSFVDPVIIGTWDGNSPKSSPMQCGPLAPGFDVRVLDFANNPVAGAVVKVRFGGSTARAHAVQNAGTGVDCPGASIFKLTDANGFVRFDPRIAGYDLGNHVEVIADGVLLRTLPVISPDFDGDGAMTLFDFIAFSSDYLNPVAQARSDFNYCLGTRLPDYVWFSGQYLAGVNQPPALLCP